MLPIGWYFFDVTAAVTRWTNGKYSKRSHKIRNRLLIEKGEITVVRSNATLAQVGTEKEKCSFIPTGSFQSATLSIYTDIPEIVDSRSKRDVQSKKKWRKQSRGRNKRKGKKCRLHTRLLDFSEVRNYTAMLDASPIQIITLQLFM